MPDRILRESILSSESLDKLTSFQEKCFYRLIVAVADDGTTDARPKILAAKLFPLRDDVRPAQISDALRALSDAELVDLYEREGKPFVRLRTWDRYQNARQERPRDTEPPTLDGTPLMSGEETRRILEAQNAVLDAAEKAGFPKTTAVYNKLIDLNTEYGMETVLQGIAACVDNSVIKISYLNGCCRRIRRESQETQKTAEPARPRRDAGGHEEWDDWA